MGDDRLSVSVMVTVGMGMVRWKFRSSDNPGLASLHGQVFPGASLQSTVDLTSSDSLPRSDVRVPSDQVLASDPAQSSPVPL